MSDLMRRPFLSSPIWRPLKVIAFIGVFFYVSVIYLSLFLGSCDFGTTVLTYMIPAVVCVMVVRRGGKRTGNLALALLSTLCVLFMGELTFRFVLRNHLTYSEQHTGGYGSLYRSASI
jgi:hypothetical protein